MSTKEFDKAKQQYVEKCLVEGLPSKAEIFRSLFDQNRLHKWLKESEAVAGTEQVVEVDAKRIPEIALLWKTCGVVVKAMETAVCGPEPKEEDFK